MDTKKVSNTLHHLLPFAISLAIYYIIAIIKPSWFARGHEIGVIISALITEFAFVSSEKRAKYSTATKIKIIVMHIIVLLLEIVLLHLLVETFGISIWIAPLLNLIIVIPVHLLLDKYLVKRGSSH